MVSVIVRTYNRKEYLLAAIDSVRRQTFRDYELIVVDDGSTDGTIEILESMSDIVLLRQNLKNNIKALNEGLTVARGQFVAFLDDDDLWDERFLETCVCRMESEIMPDLVYTDYRYFFDSDVSRLFYVKQFLRCSDILARLLVANFIPIDTVLIKMEALKTVGGFDDALLSHEEWDLWLRMAAGGCKFQSISVPLVKIRKHGHAMTDQRLNMFMGALQVLEKNRGVIPPRYGSVLESSINRLSLITAVIRVASGERLKGIASLRRNLSAGDTLSYLALPALFFGPSKLLALLVKLYGRYLLREE